MKQLLLLTTFVLLTINCCKDNPVNSVKPENRSPVIFSLTVFPEVIGPTDSAIVICNAMDPDGDTLVYDWISDGRLRIKGALAGDYSLYHTHENSRIFYPDGVNTPIDTPWVQCFARDGKGKSANRIVHFIVRQ
jgi:hypothetical protein